MAKHKSDEAEIFSSTELYDPVAIVLSGINHNTENLTDELRKCAVTYDQLSGLVEEDLRLMGMSNARAISEILNEISQLSKQQRMYDRVLRDEFVPRNYAVTVSKNSTEQLQSMQHLLNLLQAKLLLSFPRNLLLEDRIYASECCLQLCDKIHAQLDDMECVAKGEHKRKQTKIFLRKIGISLILMSGVIAVAICCTKRTPKLNM